MVDGEAVSEAKILAIWTDDEVLSTRINPSVAHYSGHAELADAIQDGLEALRYGDETTACFRLGRAVQLAHESGNDATMRLLERFVEIDDPAPGAVRVRRRDGPDDPAGQGVREPRRPTPPHHSGAIRLPPPDSAA
jgi:hypothetical protein